MKRVLIPLLLLSVSYAGYGQDIYLNKCWEKVEQNYPRAKDKPEYERIASLKIENLMSGYYPRLDANAQATYQSEVTKLDLSKLPISGFSVSPMPKDQYKLSIDLSQLVWDGGAIKAAKDIERASMAANQSQVDVDLYSLKSKVAQLFYGIALKDAQVKLQYALKANLEEKLKTTASAVRNGASLKANELMIRSEIISIDQQVSSALSDKQGLSDALSILMGEKISPDARFVWDNPSKVDVKRPEYAQFMLQKELLETSKQNFTAKRLPKISAFGQVGYGRPGLNMLNPDFSSFYLVGLKATWNIFDWNNAKHEKQSLQVQQTLVDSRQSSFEMNKSIELAQEVQNYNKYGELIRSDDELVAARAEVAKAYSVMYDNGAINASDYISRQTELKQAELNREMHKVMQALSNVNLSIIKGKE